MRTLQHKPLGQLLITRGTVTADHLDRALEEQKRSNHQKLLGEVLVDLQLCSEEQVTEALAETYDIPFAKLTPKLVDADVISLLPASFIEKHSVLPMFLVEGMLTVAMAEPANVFLIEEVERVSGHPVHVVAASLQDIRATMHSFSSLDFSRAGRSGVETVPGESPVAKLMDQCIAAAVQDGATDIHIEPGESFLRIRYRIDGRMVEKLRPPFGMRGAIAARIKSLAGLEASDRLTPRNASFQTTVEGRSIDLHVSTVPGKFGEKIVIRLIDQVKAAASLEKLGFGYDTLKQWRKLLAKPGGTLIVTGPAGAGKTSTLYASLQEINSLDLNLCTVEDPVEYALPGINQFQVDDRRGFSLVAALESVLRQDPDVVMLSEMRDTDLAKCVAQAAMTGCRVLTTLPTADAVTAITRLFNLGLEPYVVGASLSGVLAQRLVRKLCQGCKEPYTPTISERRLLEKFGGSMDTLYRAKGCPRCGNLGYRGRIGVQELLTIDDMLSERISQGILLTELREIAQRAGMKTLRADGIDKVKAGITTMEEIFRVTA